MAILLFYLVFSCISVSIGLIPLLGTPNLSDKNKFNFKKSKKIYWYAVLLSPIILPFVIGIIIAARISDFIYKEYSIIVSDN